MNVYPAIVNSEHTQRLEAEIERLEGLLNIARSGLRNVKQYIEWSQRGTAMVESALLRSDPNATSGDEGNTDRAYWDSINGGGHA